MTQTTETAAIRTAFIERVGLITQAEGLPRIAGRVFGMLLFDGQMVSFGDLATQLQVSRASISTSVRLLEERGLVSRMTKPGERQDYFQLAENPYATMLMGVQRRARNNHRAVTAICRALPEGEGARARLQAYADFYASLDAAFDSMLARSADGTPTRTTKDHTDDH